MAQSPRLLSSVLVKKLLPYIGLVLLVAFVFGSVHSFSFLNFDDNVYVTGNTFVPGGLTREGIAWAFTHAHGGHYHPLSWLSHMLDVELFGQWAGGHHLVSVGIHALNTALLYALLLRVVTVPAGVAFLLAGVFGVHPLRIESVAWVSERKDVLSMFFLLLAVHTYLWHRRSPGTFRFLLVLLCQVLALLSKPSAVVLPLLCLLLDFWPLGRKVFSGSVLLEKIPFLFCSLAASLSTLWAQGSAGALQTVDVVPVENRLSTALVAWMTYVGKLLFPTQTGIFYPSVVYAPGIAAGALTGLLCISAFCISRRKELPFLLMGWLWFLVSALPVVGFVSVGGQAFADRWTYLPHVGILIAVAGVFRVFDDRPSVRRYGTAIAVGVLAIYTGITLQQLPHWATSESIFTHTLRVSPQNFMAHTNLGSALDAAGKEREAAVHYEEAYRLNPTYPEAINNLGAARARQGRYSEAIGLFEKALAIRPDMQTARSNLALARELAGRVSSRSGSTQ